ncbi:MAG TPA: transglycosylase family protein [Solirubrobacteraceae bacterium]
MLRHKQVLATGAVMLFLPASVAFAANRPAASPPAAAAASAVDLAARNAGALERAGVRHERAVRRVVRLARARAHLGGTSAPHRATYAGWSTPRLHDQAAHLGRLVRNLRRTGGAPGVAIPAALIAIAACESGGNPQAVDASGTYRGLFQFDSGTWASVGGHGDPAAAPAAEQYRRAALLYARSGAAPWPVCGR